MSNRKFKVGDQVQLKDQLSPVMTVWDVSFDENTGEALDMIYFDKKRNDMSHVHVDYEQVDLFDIVGPASRLREIEAEQRK